MERINWMEFKEIVPKKIETVLLPTGTLEPHGITGSMEAYPGAFQISEAAYRPYMRDVVAERYSEKLATAYPAPGTWAAFPFPSTVGLYQPGQGYPRFDQKKADEYFRRVSDKVAALIAGTIAKWDDGLAH
jgi:hypothetical protein